MNRNQDPLALDVVDTVQRRFLFWGGILPELKEDELNLCKEEIKHDDIKQFFQDRMFIYGKESWSKSPS